MWFNPLKNIFNIFWGTQTFHVWCIKNPRFLKALEIHKNFEGLACPKKSLIEGIFTCHSL